MENFLSNTSLDICNTNESLSLAWMCHTFHQPLKNNSIRNLNSMLRLNERNLNKGSELKLLTLMLNISSQWFFNCVQIEQFNIWNYIINIFINTMGFNGPYELFSLDSIRHLDCEY